MPANPTPPTPVDTFRAEVGAAADKLIRACHTVVAGQIAAFIDAQRLVDAALKAGGTDALDLGDGSQHPRPEGMAGDGSCALGGAQPIGHCGVGRGAFEQVDDGDGRKPTALGGFADDESRQIFEDSLKGFNPYSGVGAALGVLRHFSLQQAARVATGEKPLLSPDRREPAPECAPEGAYECANIRDDFGREPGPTFDEMVDQRETLHTAGPVR